MARPLDYLTSPTRSIPSKSKALAPRDLNLCDFASLREILSSPFLCLLRLTRLRSSGIGSLSA